MSTDQPTLSEYLVAEETDDDTEVTPGAAYGRPRKRDGPSGEPADAGCCQTCGRDLRADPDISDDVLRVVGDNHERVPVCNADECIEQHFPASVQFEGTARLSYVVRRARDEIGVVVR